MEFLGLLDLAGFVALLLWGLHLVQGGVMDAYGAAIRKILRHSLKHRLTAFAAGLGTTTLLQSSTATGLIAAGFTASGLIDLVTGLGIMLGANVGTTLIVLLLSFNITALIPILVLAGVMLSKFGRTDRQKDIARAVIGLGLMLFALSHMTGLLSEASKADNFKTLLMVMTADPVLCVGLGALLAWTMHSSIAVVLLIMSFTLEGLLPLPSGFAMVLGANLGSAINPVLNMMTRKNPAALRLPIGNLINRLIGGVAAFPLLGLAASQPALTASANQAPALFHLLFNLLTALLFLPFLGFIAKRLEQWLPETVGVDAAAPLYLEDHLTATPSLAIAAASREVMRMSDIAQNMLVEVSTAFHTQGQDQIAGIRHTDDVLDALNRSIKIYLTSIPANALSDTDRRRLDQVVYAAMTFEQVGDIISNNLAGRVGKLLKRQQVLSSETLADLAPIFQHVTSNVSLTSTVFMTGEKRAMKRLFEEKHTMDRLEARASQIHLDRLREGSVDGIETSALEIDTLHDLRQINDHLVSIAVAIMRSKDGKTKQNNKLTAGSGIPSMTLVSLPRSKRANT
ncbi:MAG: Na/Pi cotransporter family protein [Asticcacaulis sp.]|uniref:Na/Pi cotransporter family protein n=1 Tax=Asticcacaulis sp. TaxID=1872648 RepID=UPI0039E5CEE9